jgi:Flp pilus assembly protein TadD
MKRPFSSSSWLAGIALVVLSWLVFGQARDFDFVNWDDHEYVADSPAVREGLSWDGLVAAFTSNVAGNWHPVTVLSHQLDVELFGLDSGGHHLTSVLIHIANGLLLFGLLRRMTGGAGASAFVAGVFLLHPLHVESVVWVSERKDVLSTFFAFATIAAYLRYIHTPGPGRYALVVVLYALALLAKPMVVTLPCLLLLLDHWPLGRARQSFKSRRTWPQLLVEKAPLAALALAVGLVTLATQAKVGAVATLEALSLVDRIGGAVTACAWYLWKSVWPSGLAAFYPRVPITAIALGSSALLLALITGVAVVRRRSDPYVLIGWMWYLVAIAPVIGIIQVGEQARADRYTYLPLVGIAIAAAWTMSSLAAHSTPSRTLITGAAIAAILAFVVISRAQAAYWMDSLALWRRAIAVTNVNYRAYENLGTALRERGQYDEALAAYAEAARHSPNYAVVYNSMGLVLTRQGRMADAIRQYEHAVTLSPGFPEARTNLANALAATGQLDAALGQYVEAGRLSPDSTETHIGLGSTLIRMGRPAEAEKEFLEAVRLDPALAEAQNGLGGALAMQGRHAEAVPRYQEAIRLKPGLVTAHTNLGLSLVKLGRVDEARQSFETALRVDPNYQPALQALSAIR